MPPHIGWGAGWHRLISDAVARQAAAVDAGRSGSAGSFFVDSAGPAAAAADDPAHIGITALQPAADASSLSSQHTEELKSLCDGCA
jgi:hypothetical protein